MSLITSLWGASSSKPTQSLVPTKRDTVLATTALVTGVAVGTYFAPQISNATVVATKYVAEGSKAVSSKIGTVFCRNAKDNKAELKGQPATSSRRWYFLWLA